MITLLGLGNPGEKYRLTRHNVGHVVLNQLLGQLEAKWENEKYLLDSEVANVHSGEHAARLIKPSTFINESGRVAGVLSEQEGFDSTNLWVVHDDTEIPFGEIRVKRGGTSGGHNGIKSIDQAIGPDYWRVRIGVGRHSHQDLSDYVLSRFTAEEQKLLPSIIDRVADFLIESIEENELSAVSFRVGEQQD